MFVFMTNGTYDYLASLQKKHAEQQMYLMLNPKTALLFHETEGPSIFKSGRKYEVIEAAGTMEQTGFAVMNHIPVTEEGRPVFEYRFKTRAKLIEKEPGFKAFRLLRPAAGDTYIVFTLWKNESAFLQWKESASFAQAHDKKESLDSPSAVQKIFSGPSYVSQYTLPAEEE
ncbi:MAG TPA: antibiotic biosynthesis monooxygenase [Bacillus sp. (in: firmicutes)]|uniref:antibiotic biosynthesis monooxygenase family protein n=1 Tax=Bacillus litorisediminis TaxID=2922713 RepID=UPI001FAB89E7|nr:antibiotic biosynthesis monooxygenase [Bacillus litorisediminis]HWO74802.1 antibiotic biosynthesis monooxygenase [Bacillus sp. (in: firmicutes)]